MNRARLRDLGIARTGVTVIIPEEAILNAMTAAETMTGHKKRIVHALPLDEVQKIMQQYHAG